MTRQRLRFRGSRLASIGRLIVVLLGLALIWYGLMATLLALKADPATIDRISGYRTAFDWIAGVKPEDIDQPVRIIAGVSGLLVFLIFGFTAWRGVPRPYLARNSVRLAAGQADGGAIAVAPRAVERMAELAALDLPTIGGASARYGETELTVNVTPNRADDLPATLRATRAAVRTAFGEHGLPTVPVDVVLVGLDRKQRREPK